MYSRNLQQIIREQGYVHTLDHGCRACSVRACFRTNWFSISTLSGAPGGWHRASCICRRRLRMCLVYLSPDNGVKYAECLHGRIPVCITVGLCLESSKSFQPTFQPVHSQKTTLFHKHIASTEQRTDLAVKTRSHIFKPPLATARTA